MKAADAATRMLTLEHHPDREFSVEEFLHWLLGLDDEDVDSAGKVMLAETRRAQILATAYYAKVTGRVAIGNRDIDSAVAFLQGATFAAAALGHQPDGKPGR